MKKQEQNPKWKLIFFAIVFLSVILFYGAYLLYNLLSERDNANACFDSCVPYNCKMNVNCSQHVKYQFEVRCKVSCGLVTPEKCVSDCMKYSTCSKYGDNCKEGTSAQFNSCKDSCGV